MKNKRPRILFYDIETSLLKGLLFRPGSKISFSHKQLMPLNQYTKIICITYCWNDGKPGKALTFDLENAKECLIAFDKLASEADIVIGKNSDSFDNKHINTHRLMLGLPGRPDWIKYTDDLQKQFKKHFNLPSQTLDYISNLLGVGGKVSMQLSDWVQIHCYRELQQIEKLAGTKAAKQLSNYMFNTSYSEVMREGKKALDLMVHYGTKDVTDTREIWEHAEKHFEPKYHANLDCKEYELHCKHCGSDHITPFEVKTQTSGQFQTYFCHDHEGYAGRHRVLKNPNKKPKRLS